MTNGNGCAKVLTWKKNEENLCTSVKSCDVNFV